MSDAFKQHGAFSWSELMTPDPAVAREFLAEPRASVSQVAYEVGFNDLSYFGRVFRRLVGVPASHFRQRLQVQAVAALSAHAESFQSSADQG